MLAVVNNLAAYTVFTTNTLTVLSVVGAAFAVLFAVVKTTKGIAQAARLFSRLDTLTADLMGHGSEPSAMERIKRIEKELPPNGVPLAVKLEQVKQQVLDNHEVSLLASRRAADAVAAANEAVLEARTGRAALSEALLAGRTQASVMQENQNALIVEVQHVHERQTVASTEIGTKIAHLKDEIEDEMANRMADTLELLAERGGPDLRLPSPRVPASAVTTRIETTTTTTDATPLTDAPPAEGSP